MMTADKQDSEAKAANAHKIAEASPAEGDNLLLGAQIRNKLYSIGLCSAHTFVSSGASQGCHMRVRLMRCTRVCSACHRMAASR